MKSSKIVFLFILCLFKISKEAEYKIPTTSDINTVHWDIGRDNIKPGDIFKYEKGIHKNKQYLSNIEGLENKNIIITGEEGAIIEAPEIIFEKLNYITIENLEVRNSESHGISIMYSDNIIIQNNKIHHAYLNGIKASGKNYIIRKNTIEECNQINVNGTGEQWGQSIGTEVVDTEDKMSHNFTIEDNLIKDSWGEGIGLGACNYCIVKKNKIENAFGTLIYVDRSQNCLIDANIGYISNEIFNRNGQRSHGLGLGTEHWHNIDVINITFSNNLIINPGVGVMYYAERGHYENIHVTHNTIFNSSEIIFKFDTCPEPEKVKDNEVSNNVFSGKFARIQDDHERSSWKVFANYWIGNTSEGNLYPLNDSIGYEGTSVVVKDKIAKGFLFNFTDDFCYMPECYFPGGQLYKKGKKSSYSGDVDYYGKPRDLKNPSIGFVEGNKNYSYRISISFIWISIIFIILIGI